MPGDAVIEFGTGFQRFHRKRFVNYQLNRAHGLGWITFDDAEAAGRAAPTIGGAGDAFARLSERAVAGDRRCASVGFARLAEFFTSPRSPERIVRYRGFRDLFDAAFPSVAAQRHEVAYSNGHLPAYRLDAGGGARGTVIIHGGFDSLIEEFLAIWQRVAAAGFDVIAFDGPGQGGARALSGLTFDHDWEKPVGAVLDHFEIPEAALVGISMGGYWSLRAAANESRVERVVAWPPVYDWLLRMPAPVRPPARLMLRQRSFMRWSVRARARLVPTLRHVVDHVGYLVDDEDPMAVVDWFLAMNPAHLGSDSIGQDVLLQVGEHDSFQPPTLAAAQERALTAARSVRTRVFTSTEAADQHCQMGNLDLACAHLVGWLRGDQEAD